MFVCVKVHVKRKVSICQDCYHGEVSDPSPTTRRSAIKNSSITGYKEYTLDAKLHCAPQEYQNNKIQMPNSGVCDVVYGTLAQMVKCFPIFRLCVAKCPVLALKTGPLYNSCERGLNITIAWLGKEGKYFIPLEPMN